MKNIPSLKSGLIAALLVAAAAIPAFAKPVPSNLGNGLDKILENDLIKKGVITSAPATSTSTATTTTTKSTRLSKKSAAKAANTQTATTTATSFSAYSAMISKQATSYASHALTDAATGRYLVEIMPNGRVPMSILQSNLQTAHPGITVTATDANYAGHGVIEGYVPLDDVADIAKTEGVGSVILQIKPIHSAGLVTSQGVHQHRVNHVNSFYNAGVPLNLDGTGMSIGVMSDSFNSQPSAEGGTTTAQQDVASGDLPGPANPNNTQPVVVLQDYNPTPGATNEGRGMCQIVHDVAPKARIGFATADVGEVGFANNIRALGGLSGYTYPADVQQGFKGDVVCDDVSYIDEAMFQDGIVAQGVNDVVAAGVTYASSAANNWAVDGYESVYRPVANGTGLTAATNTALKNTNINLAGVPPELYAGGFHNFNPDPDQNKIDIAQLINSGSDAGFFVFQWNDPYDASAPALIEPPIFTGNGDSEGGQAVDFTVAFTAGNSYVITEVGDTTAPNNFDAIVAVIDPNGKTIIDQDTGVDETVTFFPQITGTYTIHVHPFATPDPLGVTSVPTHGPFTIKVNQANATSTMTQDFNILYFDSNGNYIADQSLTANNLINNRPIEFNVPGLNASGSQVQMVISRSNTTAPAVAANRLKYVYFGNGASDCGPAEYASYTMPVTFGHSAAAGANSVAAYEVFRPNVPEYFTSPGPVTIFFDANNQRLTTPQVRLKPDIAAADGVNNTFFPLGPVPLVGDSADDPDPFPNFHGTSAASPHCAALAALVLQAHGGPNSLSPQKVKTILQLTAFPHDLDPYSSSGTATTPNGGKIDIVINSDDDDNMGLGLNDRNSWNVTYTGPGYLKTLNFNPEGTPQTGGNPTGGNFNGFTDADFLDNTKYKFTPGMVFTSTYLFGDSVGLNSADVTHTRSNPAPFPSNPSPANQTAHEWTLNLSFANNSFTAGDVLRFSAGRIQQQDATVPQGQTVAVLFRHDYSADLLGSGLFIPEDPNGTNIQPGMTFNGTVVDGANTYPFSGRLTNKIGRGYSPLDGFGFINIEAAAVGTVPVPGVASRKTHGTAGAFDVPLPLVGKAGIECRVAGPNGSYTLVYTFDRPVSTPGSASVTQGTATVGAITKGPQPTQVTVELTNVTSPQHLIVRLSNAHDTSDAVLSAIDARMDVLVGDTNADGEVNAGDVSQTKSQSGQTIDTNNFREDVNFDGDVNSGDISVVKGKSGTALP